MTKLHEILAVESSLEKAANGLIKESKHTFGKEGLFTGMVKKLVMFREEDKNSETSEYQELTTTVDENLDYLVKPISDWLDVTFQKDVTNQSAYADIVIGDIIICKQVPVSFLLSLEKKLNSLRELYLQIPTLVPGIKWVEDTQNRPGVFRAEHDNIQLKTRKDPEYRTVYEATEHHPAQVEKVDRVLDVGRYITTTYSGRMTPLEKATRISKIDNLMSAVKRARMRANNIDIYDVEIGEAIFNYINK